MGHTIDQDHPHHEDGTMTTASTPPRVHYAPRYTLAEKLIWADEMHRSSLLVKGFAGNKANVLYALEYAEVIGMHPLAVMQGLSVIGGKPTANAGMIASLVRMAGHKLRVSYDAPTMTATCTITRVDDPTPSVVTWDMAKALRAGLVDSFNRQTGTVTARNPKDKNEAMPWEKYTPSLLKARALTEGAREACQEALFGIMYTPEELGALVDENGVMIGEPETAGGPSVVVPPVTQSAFDPQEGANLAYAGQDLSHVQTVLRCAEVAQQLDIEITTPDTGLTETLRGFLLRTAALRCPDADTMVGIYRGAESAGVMDTVIPGMEGADGQTLGEYLMAAGMALRDGRTVPLPLAVRAAQDARDAAEVAADLSSGTDGTDVTTLDPGIKAALGTGPGDDSLTDGQLRAALGSGHPEVEAAATAYMDAQQAAGPEDHPGGDALTGS